MMKLSVTYTIKVDKKNEDKVQKAVNLSQDKYCGVSEMFRAFAKLSHMTIEFLSMIRIVIVFSPISFHSKL